MSCVMFVCLACDHAGTSGFGSLHDASCPKCESSSIQVEYDEDHREEYEVDEIEEVEGDYDY